MAVSKLLTLAETAAALNAPEQTLRYWVKIGEGPPSFKLGRRRMFREEDIEAWLNQKIDTQRKDQS